MIARALWMLGGAVAGVVFAITLAWLAGAMFGPLYRSDDDMNRNVMIFLGACLFFSVVGIFAGDHLYKKNMK